MRNGEEVLGSSLAVSPVWVFQGMTLLEHLSGWASKTPTQVCRRGRVLEGFYIQYQIGMKWNVLGGGGVNQVG